MMVMLVEETWQAYSINLVHDLFLNVRIVAIVAIYGCQFSEYVSKKRVVVQNHQIYAQEVVQIVQGWR